MYCTGKMATLAFAEEFGAHPDEVENDFLKLDVYFMSLNVKSITETVRDCSYMTSDNFDILFTPGPPRIR